MTTPVRLPTPRDGPHLAAHLQSLEATLQAQLDTLPGTCLDDVATAHRASIERNLARFGWDVAGHRSPVSRDIVRPVG